MAEHSAIEWCDHTFNPWLGCTKISPGCDHCYAETWARRYKKGHLWQGHRALTSRANWQQPIRWNAKAGAVGGRARVFCASLADVFDNQVPSLWREALWGLIQITPHLDWLLLTKRPHNIAATLPADWGGRGWPNVWLGTTAENQAEADRRIPILLRVPAAVRFLSCEPLLGPLDLHSPDCREDGSGLWCPICLGGIGWVIAGGESGAQARPMHPVWARRLRKQCRDGGIPFFFKQWGEWLPTDQPGAGERIARERAYVNDVGQVVHGSRATAVLHRVGKQAAGAELDGALHRAFPQVPA